MRREDCRYQAFNTMRLQRFMSIKYDVWHRCIINCFVTAQLLMSITVFTPAFIIRSAFN